MYILAINTGGFKTETALLKEESNKLVLISEKSWNAEKSEAEKLLPQIAELLKKNNISFRDLRGIITVKGPGTFTGLRVGVTVSNTISFLLNIPSYTLDTFEYFRLKKPAGKNAALLIFAGSKGVYLSSEKEEKEPETINIENINFILKSREIGYVYGDLSKEQIKIITAAKYLKTDQTFGKTLEKAGLKGLKKEKIIKPRYIKPPGITEPKKSL